MRVLIRYKLKGETQLHTCVEEETTMAGAESVLLSKIPNAHIESSSIIENGRDYVIVGGNMLCNSK